MTQLAGEYASDSASWSSSASVASSASNAESDTGSKVVLVTGGAGFIGSHTASALLARGDKVVVIDEVNNYYDVNIKRSNIELLQREAAELSAEFVFYEGDICDRALLAEIFEKEAITHVCHLAARAGVRPSIDDPYIYVQSNVMGTVALLEMAAQNSTTNFVYASSSSVYGGSQKERFSEDDIVDEPVSQYAATKKACELMAATYNSLYGLNCTGLRFFTVYGERGRPDMAPFKFIHRVMNGITIDQYGDGSSERDYTYIGDIVDGVVRALDRPLGNAVVNLGRGTPVNLTTFIKTIESLCGRKAIINLMPMQPGDVPRTSCDTSRARKLLGYEAKVSLEEGLDRTVKWYASWQEQSQRQDEIETPAAAPAAVSPATA